LSHFQIRKNTNCLNCDAYVGKRYCEVCGQENVEPHESFWHLVSHFINDITHFDGKFFTTTKYLLTRPGYLPREYLKGRRQSYLHPIRMYLFASAMFFLLFFSFDSKIRYGIDVQQQSNSQGQSRSNDLVLLDSLLAHSTDSSSEQLLAKERNKLLKDIKKQDSVNQKKQTNEKEANTDEIRLAVDNLPDSITKTATYLSYQNQLPPDQRDGYLKKMLRLKQLGLVEKYQFHIADLNASLKQTFLHSIPKMFFISLPMFALILYLLYIKRESLLYTDHLIFGLHHFTAVFVVATAIILIEKLLFLLSLDWHRYIDIIFILWALYYMYKSMRRFYGQRRTVTIMKFLIATLASSTITIFIALLFLISSFMMT